MWICASCRRRRKRSAGRQVVRARLRQARHDLRRDRGAGRADPDRGVRYLQALRRAGRGRAEDRPARGLRRGTAASLMPAARRRRPGAWSGGTRHDELELPFALVEPGGGCGARGPAPLPGAAGRVRTMGTYLARWGFTAQKPLRRAYEQDPAAVRRWLRRDYPAIAARAKAEGGTIFWGDETGLRSDDVRGRSVRAPGPHAGGAGQPQAGRARPDLGGDQQGRVALAWCWTARSRRRACPLPRPPGPGCRPEGLPHPRPPAGPTAPPRSAPGSAGREAEIEVFHLPGYSPELKPDEGINGDLKQAVTRKAPARSKAQLSAPSSGTCASCRSCPTASAASSGTRPSATPRRSRSPRPDQ